MTKADQERSDWQFRCPRCEERFDPGGTEGCVCPACLSRFSRRDGVWHLLLPAQEARYAPFLDSYTRIRHAEGRFGDGADSYRRLPDCPRSHPLAAQWRIRRYSFHSLIRLLRSSLPAGARVLDLGAGTGWLSHRLHEAGYRPCAVDISGDPRDGLGASRHFPGTWPRVVAEFDRVPLENAQADAVIYNASFHYSVDYGRSLAEARRLLRDGGLVVVLDSPVYRDRSSGERMLRERHDDFERRFGERSDSLPMRGFLTWDELSQLGRKGGFEWRHRQCWYGTRWAMRPLVATLLRRREPARFALIWAQR